ncbi:MAG: hypothetical protein LIO62_02940 [Clostridiales bacterium]|nr:hypothetical protein [Clostridiales bacterium]
MGDKKVIRYFGWESKQDFIDETYAQQTNIVYKKAEYTLWLDGRGYCIAITSIGTRHATHEEHINSLKAYDTVEELVEDYVFYDGMKLSDAIEKDIREIREPEDLKFLEDDD